MKGFIAYQRPATDAYVVDGPAFVDMHSSTVSKTYGQYCEQELAVKIKNLASTALRVDVVFDVYQKVSIKRETRESRGSGIRVSVRPDTPLIKNTRGTKAFLQNDDNKTRVLCVVCRCIDCQCQ